MVYILRTRPFWHTLPADWGANSLRNGLPVGVHPCWKQIVFRNNANRPQSDVPQSSSALMAAVNPRQWCQDTVVGAAVGFTVGGLAGDSDSVAWPATLLHV